MGQRSGYGSYIFHNYSIETNVSCSGEHEGSRRMKTELLIQMDGLSRCNDLVFLLAASNLHWQVTNYCMRNSIYFSYLCGKESYN